MNRERAAGCPAARFRDILGLLLPLAYLEEDEASYQKHTQRSRQPCVGAHGVLSFRVRFLFFQAQKYVKITVKMQPISRNGASGTLSGLYFRINCQRRKMRQGRAIPIHEIAMRQMPR